MIEPARRTYDAEAREQLVELFGPPERWGTTTRSFALAPGRRARARLRRLDHVPRPGAVHATTMELVAAKYFYALPDGEVPLAFNFNGTIYYRGDDGRLQMSLVPWSCSAGFRLPIATLARPRRALLPQQRRGSRVAGRDAARAAAREGAAGRAHDGRAAWPTLLEEGGA